MHFLHEHTHNASGFWVEYFELLTDPAHILFELTFTLVFDGVILALLYGLVFKKILWPKLKAKADKQFHKEHGLNPDSCEPDEDFGLLTPEEISELRQLLKTSKFK